MTEGQAIQGILFDVHDTLIIKDYRAIRQGLLNSVCALQELGYEVSYQEYEAAWRQAARVARRDPQELGEVTFQEWYDILFTNLGLAGYGRDLMHKVNLAWNQAFASATRALPQTKGVLRRLRPLYRLGIVSTSLAPNTLLDLRVAGILDFFDAIIISSDVGKRKPHPLIFLKALERMGLEPGQALFVGDNLYEDILGAKGVGMKAVLITHPLVEAARRRRGNAGPDPAPACAEPDARIRGLNELLPVLQSGTLGSIGGRQGLAGAREKSWLL